MEKTADIINQLIFTHFIPRAEVVEKIEFETLLQARKVLTDNIAKHNFGYMYSERQMKVVREEIDKIDNLLLRLWSKSGEKCVVFNDLLDEMRADKSEGSLYYAWQANIAMAMYDELDGKITKEEANRGAKRFLEILLT